MGVYAESAYARSFRSLVFDKLPYFFAGVAGSSVSERVLYIVAVLLPQLSFAFCFDLLEFFVNLPLSFFLLFS